MGLAAAEIIDDLMRSPGVFHTSTEAIAGAVASLGDRDFLSCSYQMVKEGRDYRHLPQIRAVPPCGELRHLFIYEPFFLLRHIELHLNVPLSVCHGQPPFLIRVWDIPASNFDCSGKGPEQRKIRKRVLACCAC